MKFFKKISIYTFAGFLNAGISFFLMPYLSHFIKPGEYGILSMINAYVTILIPLIGLAGSGIITVDYFKMKDKKEFASLFSSVQLIPLLPALFFLIVNLVFPSLIASLFEIPADKSYWLSLSVVVALLNIYIDTFFAFMVIEQKAGLYALFNLAKLLIEVGLTVWFVAGLKMSWEGRLLSWLITTIVFFFVSLFYFQKQNLLTARVSRKYVIAGVSFGLPLVLHVIGKFVINQSDRVFIAKMVSIDEAGIYNIGYQVGMVMLVLVNAIGNFIYPFINERLENPTDANKRQIVKTSYAVTGLSFLALLVITFASPYFFSWLVDKSYAESTVYVFWVALSYFFWGVYMIFSGYIFYTKDTGFLGWISVLSVVLNIALNYVLILNFGAIGAAYATCISFFIIAVLTAVEANKRIPLPWNIFILKKTA
ncbi:MAG: oligosaccharide flippase family protein [Chitinophagaceae bacterium]|jgi:O-antigen/teichoic acid export membrane protein|nr:oligosaccharide flippase family protein [Chitinophagaceae bacterium]OQY95711.1 MAG: hypothetical protein B6D37_04455 [Sphingobacteriales bacterium UTBCD1]